MVKRLWLLWRLPAPFPADDTYWQPSGDWRRVID